MANAMESLQDNEETSVDNKTLMNCIQQYRVLCDKTCKDFKMPLKKTGLKTISKVN